MPTPDRPRGPLRVGATVLGIWALASMVGGIVGTCIGSLPDASAFAVLSPVFAVMFGIGLAPATLPAVAAFWWIYPDFVRTRARRIPFLMLATGVGWLIGTGYLRIWLATDADPYGVLGRAAPWGCAVGGLVAALRIHQARRHERTLSAQE
ncbi:MAG: hypothetical protein ACKO5K_12315 [Armatimonadota bacterium]